MTLEEIQKRVDAIRVEANHDNEVAHSLEDDMMRDFIRYVASLDGPASLVEKAKLVASTQQIEYDRYYA